MSNELTQIIENERKSFMSVSCDSSINFEREANFAIQILNGNKYLGDIAISNPDSLRSSVTNLSAIGLSLNPATKLAYLVPRKGQVCLDVSYFGLMHLAQVSGAIQWGQAVIVRANDTFELNGVDKQPTHTYRPFDGVLERGEVVGCYVVVKTDTGDFLTHTMTAGAINAIRDRSEAWKKNKSGPWATDYEEMAKKTVVKQAAKYWPRRDRVDTAIHYMNTEAGEGINFEAERVSGKPTLNADYIPEGDELIFIEGVYDTIIANRENPDFASDYLYEKANLDADQMTWIWNKLGDVKIEYNGKERKLRGVIREIHDATTS
jgi:recombination protein RecT